MTHQNGQYDVAIIGGGPGGSTLASMLCKYDPKLRVVVLEKEKFPRDHVGESLLPPINDVLEEMGCWNDVEAANFPIKIGASYRWGKKPEVWHFNFIPVEEFRDEPRPAKHVGQRCQTAFQVDRAIYDNILLRNAEKLGAEVREKTRVKTIHKDGDRITSFELADGSHVTAKYYMDASGHIGALRRAMNIGVTVPTALQNISFWGYWQNAEWAFEIGVGATRVQVMSVGFGWLWFIPLGPTRTSLGLVCPAKYYKESGKTPEQLYDEAVHRDPLIRELIANAEKEEGLHTTTDWSFLADRLVGENWFLVGEAAGFADPVLTAGLTLTHTGAREAAYTILALNRGEHDPQWLLKHYNDTQKARIKQHIRFADYWYAANGQFTDLQEYCAEIAKDSGLRLSPQSAWRWLAQGGFTNDDLGHAAIGVCDVAGLKQIMQLFSEQKLQWQVSNYNIFKLNLVGANRVAVPRYVAGRIEAVPCYCKGERRLPVAGMFATLIETLSRHQDIQSILSAISAASQQSLPAEHVALGTYQAMQTLEVMIADGWVIPKLDKKKPRLDLDTPVEGDLIHTDQNAPMIGKNRNVGG